MRVVASNRLTARDVIDAGRVGRDPGRRPVGSQCADHIGRDGVCDRVAVGQVYRIDERTGKRTRGQARRGAAG